MEKIKFEDGQLVSTGYVEIDGIQYEIHEAVYAGNTPLSALVINKMQNNIEEHCYSTILTTKIEAGGEITLPANYKVR